MFGRTIRRKWLSLEGSESLRAIKWITILVPILFLAGVEIVRRTVYPEFFNAWPGYVLLGGIVLLGVLAFAEIVFTVIGDNQDELTRRNRELIALHESGLAITRELDLETVLQRVVEEATDLVDTRYGALSLVDENGEIEMFLTSGISPELREKIGPPPTGHGVLGVVIRDAQSLRLSDVSKHSQSTGFPPHHPPMHSLLAVPVISGGRVLGSLYLSEKESGLAFDAHDQAILERFATQTALAIDNARLHQRVQALAIAGERERIAREMHDSLAQLLGYVNLKAQAVQELLRNDRTEQAGQQLGQLAGAARDAYADVREGILALRTTSQPDRSFDDTLRRHLEQWEDQSGITINLETEDGVIPVERLSSTAELQLLRIIQESLANVRKHAHATAVRVAFTAHPDTIEVIIEDNGTGFDPDTIARTGFPRFGLTIMQERAQSVGGSLNIDAAPGSGTRVTTHIPVQTAATMRSASP